ncbi:MAG: Cell division protein SepF [Succiniclasticum sp.]|jgi:cell division inhibitor SepF
MAKKRILDRISDALGLYDPDEDEEMDLTPEEEAEQPAQKASAPAVRKSSASAAEEPEGKEKKSFFRRSKKKADTNLIQMKAMTDIRVVVLEPEGFDDCQHIADCLAKDQPVVVNFENTDMPVRQRITDFVTGTVYALHGTIRSIGPNILVCAPHNVNVDAEAELYGMDRE